MNEKLVKPFKVLSLDGGGGKGIYTLAVLREVEKLVGKPLRNEFDFFYGTSTGSIIAAALACGESVDNIIHFYFDHLPKIMRTFTSKGRSLALRSALQDFFGDRNFESLDVGLGIVGTNQDDKRAIVFKSLPSLAHGMKQSFKPGFGVSIADAVEASCSAYPFFCPKRIVPQNSAPVNVIDGGFVANNPALYALVDVREALKIKNDDLRILSIGTGTYPETFPIYSYLHGIRMLPILKMISMQFTSNANAVEMVFKLLSNGIPTFRVNETFAEPELATSLFEYRRKVLDRLLNKGRNSYSKFETEITKLLRE